MYPFGICNNFDQFDSSAFAENIHDSVSFSFCISSTYHYRLIFCFCHMISQLAGTLNLID